MDPLEIIYQYYRPQSEPTNILVQHGEAVRDKALAVAANMANLEPDVHFIAEAAMLHDIGILNTMAPSIGCHGRLPYVCHGVEGRNMLEKLGLKQHALVCERHVGVGLTRADIQQQKLPLPRRDMLPVSLEEAIICYADKFFSKTNGPREKPVEEIFETLKHYGSDKVERFVQWHRQFNKISPNG